MAVAARDDGIVSSTFKTSPCTDNRCSGCSTAKLDNVVTVTVALGQEDELFHTPAYAQVMSVELVIVCLAFAAFEIPHRDTRRLHVGIFEFHQAVENVVGLGDGTA